MKREKEFILKIEELSGQNLSSCYQCGKCSAGCPIVESMEILPNQAIRLAQLGLSEVLDFNTIWVCASCLTCTARCPRGVDLTRVMEALRQVVLRKKIDRVKLSKLKKKDLEELPQIALISSFRKKTG